MLFNHEHARDYCKSKGLIYDERQAAKADQALSEANLTQPQFDAALGAHIDAVAHLFTPSNYSFKQRFLIAVFFLFRLK